MTVSKTSTGSLISSAITIICSATSVEEVGSIILLVIGIISAVFSLGFNIWSWYLKAHADGKISNEEIEELKSTVEKGTEEIKDVANKERKE